MASSLKKSRKRETYSTGEKGANRVRLFPHPRNGTLYLEFRDAGKRKRICLSTTDMEVGKQAASALALNLREGAPRKSVALTLRTLFERYESEVTPKKGKEKRRHDVCAHKLFLECWGPGLKVEEINRGHWDRFIEERRSGALRPEGREKRAVAGCRAIAYDLKHLRAVLSWAQSVRENGKPLLSSFPVKGFELPRQSIPNRPGLSEEEHSRLIEAAERIGGIAPLFLVIVRETGHRSGAVGSLRWSDLRLHDEPGASWVTWRKEHDKSRREHRTPLSERAAVALKAAQLATARIGDAWVFSAPKDSTQRVSRHNLHDLWKRLEREAGIERKAHRGWHSLRRKFATDLKDRPVKDVCELGGWTDAATMLRCYQSADEGTMRSALASLERRSVGA